MQLRRYKPWGLVGLFMIVLLIVWNTYVLFDLVKTEERTKMQLWATAQQEIIENNDLNRDFSTLAFEVIQDIGSVPILLVNEKEKIIDLKNIDWQVQEDPDSLALYSYLKQLKKENKPLSIQYKDIVNQKLYYGDSSLLKKLKYYPLALLLILFLFAGVLYFFFQSSVTAEQNRLWVGMAKETAHQIGTPLTSLMGWITLLKEQNIAPASIEEMEKDIERLHVITDRFSKVGSRPELHLEDIVQVTATTLGYLKKRSAQHIRWEWDLPKAPIPLLLNPPLFSWTLENLAKNGMDAMKGKGNLKIELKAFPQDIRLYISDTGGGISSSHLKRIFQPGYTTKSRGWGLGLSLAKRIVEDYHQGHIRVAKTTLGKGTTFEILLPRPAEVA